MMENARLEIRSFVSELRLVDGEDGQPPTIRGYAAVFNQRSEDLGGFIEIIEPEAFDGVLNDDVRALWNHDRSLVLGRTASGTLRLWVDDSGLGYEVTPPETSWAQDAMVTMRRGDVNQSSFGFYVPPDGDAWEDLPDGRLLRRVNKVEELLDVSPVTFPAYPQTSASVRSRMQDARCKNESDAAQGSGDDDNAGARDGSQGRLDVMRRRLDLEEVAV